MVNPTSAIPMWVDGGSVIDPVNVACSVGALFATVLVSVVMEVESESSSV